MWILFLIMVVIGAASDRGWARPLRLDIGWVTINFFLMPVILGLGVAIFRGGHYQQQYPTLRKHPVYIWSLLLLGFATFTGNCRYHRKTDGRESGGKVSHVTSSAFFPYKTTFS